MVASQGTVTTGNTPGDTTVAANLGTINAGGAFATIRFDVTINNPLPVGTFRVVNQGVVSGAAIVTVNTDDPDTPAAADPTVTLLNTSMGKTIIGSNQAFTPLGQAAIGEILNYQLVLQVNPGTLNNVTLVDSLPLGMAFVNCVSITTSSPDLTTSEPSGFPGVCAGRTVGPIPDGNADPVNQGRKVTFDFKNLTNSGAGVVNLTIEYRVVVLDTIENQSGDTLTNSAIWYSGPTVLMTARSNVQVVEPNMEITKSVNQNTALPGTELTYRLRIAHLVPSSTADAFDLEVRDVLPAGLTYVAGSLRNVSGQPAVLNDAGAPTLIATWASFLNNGIDSVIEFKAIFVGGAASVSNTASLSWTSLPGVVSAPQTPINLLSHERDYDPGFSGGCVPG